MSKRLFITYGDNNFENAKIKLINNAKSINEFDDFIAFGSNDVTEVVTKSKLFNIKRGGGLWVWKPDVILTAIKQVNIGDYIIYCDAGCSLYSSKEWSNIWELLDKYDIIAQRMYHPTYKWTRKELINYFSDNGKYWDRMCQFMATAIIIKVSDFTTSFIEEWRNIMINYPEFVMDVEYNEIHSQNLGFKQNRHDQAVYSALIYKYIKKPLFKEKIYCIWEHIDYYDPFFKQAIRATRLRYGESENKKIKLKNCLIRLIKDYLFKPFYYEPLHFYYSIKNNNH